MNKWWDDKCRFFRRFWILFYATWWDCESWGESLNNTSTSSLTAWIKAPIGRSIAWMKAFSADKAAWSMVSPLPPFSRCTFSIAFSLRCRQTLVFAFFCCDLLGLLNVKNVGQITWTIIYARFGDLLWTYSLTLKSQMRTFPNHHKRLEMYQTHDELCSCIQKRVQ